MRPRFFAAGLFALLAYAPAHASQSHGIAMQPGAQSDAVAVESFYDQKPGSGFMPVRVTLRNDSDSPRQYTLSYAPSWRHGNYEDVSGAFTLSVAPGSRAATVVYAPVVPSQYMGPTTFRLSGPGVRSGEFQLQSNSSYGSSTEGFVGLGEVFAARHVGAVEAEAKASGAYHGNLPLSKVGAAFAPADRRAYDGFSSLWFYDNEWTALEPAAQAAVREWVALGGKLHLVADSGKSSAESLGFGEIRRVVRGDDEKALIKRVVESLRVRNERTPAEAMAEGQSNLFRAFAAGLEARPLILIVLLLAFGLIVGPLNLFVFAKPPRRHRLLWTTPLIAVAAAVLMMTFILFADGTGGAGRRFALAVLEPGEKRLALWQQQISRSGLLLGSDFAFESSAQLVPIRDNSSGGGSNDSIECEKTPSGWAGDWFTSRAVQAQAVFDTAASRGGLRVAYPADGKPGSVVSSLDTPLKDVLVIGPDGAAYTASDLAPGVSRPLVRAADKDAAMGAWTASLNDAGELLRGEGSRLAGRTGRFYARSAKPESLLRPTLDSIRWSNDVLLITGPVETQN